MTPIPSSPDCCGAVEHRAIDGALRAAGATNRAGATISPTSTDPDDDHVLACALAAQADLVISGDSDLLNLKSFQRIPIVDAAEALERIARRYSLE